ncbi:sugar phosphate isomerase/epimerase, partial [Candidatus Bipolaricaulota bacterium]|nr:sugar phosphate isomerase/epimerase [Candidatus Bipolaricaulota bacterium]
NQSNDAGREPVCNYLERYAGQLIHLHLHDNHGELDEHLLPGEGNVDWPRVLGVLEDIGFSGTAVLEAYQEGVPPRDGLRRGIDFFRQT